MSHEHGLTATMVEKDSALQLQVGAWIVEWVKSAKICPMVDGNRARRVNPDMKEKTDPENKEFSLILSEMEVRDSL